MYHYVSCFDVSCGRFAPSAGPRWVWCCASIHLLLRQLASRGWARLRPSLTAALDLFQPFTSVRASLLIEHTVDKHGTRTVASSTCCCMARCSLDCHLMASAAGRSLLEFAHFHRHLFCDRTSPRLPLPRRARCCRGGLPCCAMSRLGGEFICNSCVIVNFSRSMW